MPFCCDRLHGNAILPWLSLFHRQCLGGTGNAVTWAAVPAGFPHRQLIGRLRRYRPAPHGRRTAGAVCATDCRLLTLSGQKLVELCYQDAKLAVFLARLLAGYVYVERRTNQARGREWQGQLAHAPLASKLSPPQPGEWRFSSYKSSGSAASQLISTRAGGSISSVTPTAVHDG